MANVTFRSFLRNRCQLCSLSRATLPSTAFIFTQLHFPMSDAFDSVPRTKVHLLDSLHSEMLLNRRQAHDIRQPDVLWLQILQLTTTVPSGELQVVVLRIQKILVPKNCMAREKIPPATLMNDQYPCKLNWKKITARHCSSYSSPSK